MTTELDSATAGLDALENRFDECRRKGQATIFEMGAILSAIFDRKLYRADYKTFDVYCEQRWGFTGARGRQWIDAFQVAKNLSDSINKDRAPLLFAEMLAGFKEEHARHIKKLPSGQQADAWQDAKNRSGGESPKPHVLEQVVAEHKEKIGRLESLTFDEEHEAMAEIEESARTKYRERRVDELLRMFLKRTRAVLEQSRSIDLGLDWLATDLGLLVSKVEEVLKSRAA